MTKFLYNYRCCHLFVIVIQVLYDDDPSSSASAALRKRLCDEDSDLTTKERLKIRQFLEACPDDEYLDTNVIHKPV